MTGNTDIGASKTIGAAELCERLSAVIVGLGAPIDVATEVAKHLVRAELSGHSSHGVLRLPQYAREIDAGIINPAAPTTIVSKKPSAIVLDSQRGFGHFAAAKAVEAAAPAAIATGMAAVTIKNCTHIGRLGEYSERLAERGLISLIQVGAVGPGLGSMAPFGSKSGLPFLNTNPWAIGFPSEAGAIVLDAAMSTIPEGKVHAAKNKGTMLPEGSLLDPAGRPSSNPDDFYAGGTLTPLGGTIAGHKGYGLALSAALLGGLAHADGTPPALVGLAKLRRGDGDLNSLGGVTMIVIDPAAFGDRSSYSAAVGRVAGALHEDGVLVPGDMERRCREVAREEVSLPLTTFSELSKLEERYAKKQ